MVELMPAAARRNGMRRLLLATALLAISATATFAQANRGRPLILLVHGRGMLGRDTMLTRQMWLDGLRAGATSLSKDLTVDEGDLRVVWYADVLDLASKEGCDYAATDPRAKRDARTDSNVKQFASFAGAVMSVVSGLSGDNDTSNELRGLAADASFLSDTRKRCGTEARLASALELAKSEGRPVILVAHSLGSLIAYDYLSTRSDTGLVQRLVTIGSPVGAPEMRHFLIGGDSTDKLAMPLSVKDWVNVRNDRDPFATSLPVGRNIQTSPPADEPDPHEMVGYLRETVTAREILGAWCDAMRDNRPQGCKEISAK